MVRGEVFFLSPFLCLFLCYLPLPFLVSSGRCRADGRHHHDHGPQSRRGRRGRHVCDFPQSINCLEDGISIYAHTYIHIRLAIASHRIARDRTANTASLPFHSIARHLFLHSWSPGEKGGGGSWTRNATVCLAVCLSGAATAPALPPFVICIASWLSQRAVSPSSQSICTETTCPALPITRVPEREPRPACVRPSPPSSSGLPLPTADTPSVAQASTRQARLHNSASRLAPSS